MVVSITPLWPFFVSAILTLCLCLFPLASHLLFVLKSWFLLCSFILSSSAFLDHLPSLFFGVWIIFLVFRVIFGMSSILFNRRLDYCVFFFVVVLPCFLLANTKVVRLESRMASRTTPAFAVCVLRWVTKYPISWPDRLGRWLLFLLELVRQLFLENFGSFFHLNSGLTQKKQQIDPKWKT